MPKEKNICAIPRCFYCGKDKNQILLSRTLSDISELHGKVADMEPCEDCAQMMRAGVIICEVRDGESGPAPFRTGRMWVVQPAPMHRLNPSVDWNKNRFCFMPESMARTSGLHDLDPVYKDLDGLTQYNLANEKGQDPQN